MGLKITIKPTGTIQKVNGVDARVWKGTTESGAPVEMFVALVSPQSAAAEAECDAGLKTVKVDRQLVAFDYRMVM